MVKGRDLRFIGSVLVLLILSSSFSLAQGSEQKKSCFLLFVAMECPDCDIAAKHLENIGRRYPTANVTILEVYYDRDNYHLLEKYFTAFNIPEESRGIPALFTSQKYIIGSESILGLTEEEARRGTGCPTLLDSEVVGITGKKQTHDVLQTLTFSSVTASAFKDSFSAPLLALLLIALAFLAPIKDEEGTVKKGVVFILAVYFIYFITALTGFNGFGATVPRLFYQIVGVLSLGVGIIKIKAFLSTWKVLLKGMSEQTRNFLIKSKDFLLSYRGIVPIAVVATLLSITPGTPLFQVLKVIFKQGIADTVIFPLILYYCLILALPITLLVVVIRLVRQWLYDQAEEKAKQSKDKQHHWEKYYHRIINFGASTVMIIVGLILLFV